MGLGKTITVIALHLHRLERRARAGPARRWSSAPPSLLGNWEAEIERFAPGTPGPPLPRRSRRGRSRRARTTGFVLTTYGTLRSDHGTRDASGPRLRDVTWGLVVADEAQHVKNAASVDGPRPARDPRHRPRRPHRHPGREQPERALGDPRLGDPRPAGQPQRLPQGLGGADRVGRARGEDATVRRPGRPVRAAPQEVRPGHRAGAAAEDRDRPPARADPRAGGALRGVRARHHGAHRARRRGDPARPGARAAHRAEADLQPPGPVPQAVRRGAADRPVPQARPARRAAHHDPGRGRCGAGLHPVRRHGPAARGPPRPRGHRPPVPARRHARARPGRDGPRASRPARCRCSCCR